MTWTKLGDEFPDDCERAELSDAAVRTHVEALCWSNRLLLDGHIPMRHLGRFAFSQDADRAVSELLAAGWWGETEDGYLLMHDITEQRSREQVLASRETAKGRQARWRGKHRVEPDNAVTNAVTRRGRNAVTRDGTGQDRSGSKPSQEEKEVHVREDAITEAEPPTEETLSPPRPDACSGCGKVGSSLTAGGLCRRCHGEAVSRSYNLDNGRSSA
ncbi:MAG: hypothetical protein GEV09_01985 [Pseudonocardiaceae bacterium]|nr:hypothetical protein [Pseudonocardiaceae bacterium]